MILNLLTSFLILFVEMQFLITSKTHRTECCFMKMPTKKHTFEILIKEKHFEGFELFSGFLTEEHY